MKATTTNKEIKRIYFDAGSINSIPDKVRIEIEITEAEALWIAKTIIERYLELKKQKANA